MVDEPALIGKVVADKESGEVEACSIYSEVYGPEVTCTPHVLCYNAISCGWEVSPENHETHNSWEMMFHDVVKNDAAYLVYVALNNPIIRLKSIPSYIIRSI
ncbi:MAG: hypothetical protein ACFFDP_06660, partial [Promethearchaeota archaeon]